jgi:hypothetical protein
VQCDGDLIKENVMATNQNNTRGGTSEQHAKAGSQSHKNQGSSAGSSKSSSGGKSSKAKS